MMGNANGKRDGGSNGPFRSEVGSGGVGAQDSRANQDGARVNYHAHGGRPPGLLAPPAPTPSARASNSSVKFKPDQIAVVSLQRSQRMDIAGPSWMDANSLNEDMDDENVIPTMITWTHGGREVYLEGSWDSWKKRKRMSHSGKEFYVMRIIPPGVHRYRFFVDGCYRYSPDLPWEKDGFGNVFNILDLKDYVPEAPESISSIELPESPENSYNNLYPGPNDFAKEPPMVPPHLERTLLDAPTIDMEIPPPFRRPEHVVLNHLYVNEDTGSPSVIALRSTNRFLSKYVTVVLYTSK